ncbi:MAG: acyltransferase domain-containing protein [Pseudomonadota bacterium]
MGFALLFSGQGMQHPAMLPWLEPDDPLVRAVAGPGGADWRGALADAAWAGANAHAQPLLVGLGLAAWGRLAPGLPAPAAVAGYSVGELSACAAAGVFDAATALELAHARAAAMDHCIDGAVPARMAAVSGLGEGAVAALCERFGLAVAIHNGPGNVVLGGAAEALVSALEQAGAAGASCTPLNVRVPSHTHWMAGAAQVFSQVLRPLPFARPQVPLWSAALGTPLADGEAARQALAFQIDHALHWDACMEGIAARRPHCVLEVGPGHALARMWQRAFPEIPARSADEFRSAAAVRTWVQRALED